MDPITLEKLLSICHELEESRRNDSIPWETFEDIIARTTNASHLQRRTNDVARIFKELNWMSVHSKTEIHLHQHFTDFIHAWDEADIVCMNQYLRAYQPYSQFLAFLATHREFTNLPNKLDSSAKEQFTKWLQQRYQDLIGVKAAINFTVFDTFRFWVIPLGQAHCPPDTDALIWGGNWSHDTPSIAAFEEALCDAYLSLPKSSAYANIIQLADSLCRKLNISFQGFEYKFRLLLKQQPGRFTVATVTTRQYSKRTRISVIRPRIDVVEERRRNALIPRKRKVAVPWLNSRYLEDGVRLNNHLVKIIKLEKTHDHPKRSQII